jgi:ABC-type antimicrobial peptide transport system permease subunit
MIEGPMAAFNDPSLTHAHLAVMLTLVPFVVVFIFATFIELRQGDSKKGRYVLI